MDDEPLIEFLHQQKYILNKNELRGSLAILPPSVLCDGKLFRQNLFLKCKKCAFTLDEARPIVPIGTETHCGTVKGVANGKSFGERTYFTIDKDGGVGHFPASVIENEIILSPSEQKEVETAEAEMRHIHRHSDETMHPKQAEKEWDRWRFELKLDLLKKRTLEEVQTFVGDDGRTMVEVKDLSKNIPDSRFCDKCLGLNSTVAGDACTCAGSLEIQKRWREEGRQTEIKNSAICLASNFLQTLSSNPDKDKYSDKDIRQAIEIGLSEGMKKMDELVFSLTHGKWCVHEEHSVEGSVVIGVPDLLKLANSPKGDWQNTAGDKCPRCDWTMCLCDDGSQYCQKASCGLFFVSEKVAHEMQGIVNDWEKKKLPALDLAMKIYEFTHNHIYRSGWEPHKRTMLGVDRPHTVHLAMGGGGWTNTQEPCSGKLVKDENGKITCTSCDIELKETK